MRSAERLVATTALALLGAVACQALTASDADLTTDSPAPSASTPADRSPDRATSPSPTPAAPGVGLQFASDPPRWGRHEVEAGVIYGYELRVCVPSREAPTGWQPWVDLLLNGMQEGDFVTRESRRLDLDPDIGGGPGAPDWLRGPAEWTATNHESLLCHTGWTHFTTLHRGDPVELRTQLVSVTTYEVHEFALDVSPARLGFEPLAAAPDAAHGLRFASDPPVWERYVDGSTWIYGFELELCAPAIHPLIERANLTLLLDDGTRLRQRGVLSLYGEAQLVDEPARGTYRGPFEGDLAAPAWLRQSASWLGFPRSAARCQEGWAVFVATAPANPATIEAWHHEGEYELDVSPQTLGYAPLVEQPSSEPLTVDVGWPYRRAVPDAWVWSLDVTAAALERAIAGALPQVATINGEPYATLTIEAYCRAVDGCRLELIGHMDGPHADRWPFTFQPDGSGVVLIGNEYRQAGHDDPLFAAVPMQVVDAAEEIVEADREARKKLRGLEPHPAIAQWYPWRAGIVSLIYWPPGWALHPGTIVTARDGPASTVIHVDLNEQRVIKEPELSDAEAQTDYNRPASMMRFRNC